MIYIKRWMKKKFLICLVYSFSLILPALLQGNSDKIPKVLVSVDPYAYLVEKIAGKTIEIQVLIPPGVNAHLYEPTPKEIEKLLITDIWMRLGDPVEKKLVKVLQEKNPNLVLVELWKDIQLIGHEHHQCSHDHEDGMDYHIWLSPKNAKLQAEKMMHALVAMYPNHQDLYRQNLKLLLEELDELDQKLSLLLKPFQGKALLVSHPAFGYFCKEYSLMQIPIEFEGKEPRPKQLTQILKEVEKFQIKTVLTQAQYSNKGAEIIAKKLQLPIFLVDPYSRDYSKNLLHIAKVIADSNDN